MPTLASLGRRRLFQSSQALGGKGGGLAPAAAPFLFLHHRHSRLARTAITPPGYCSRAVLIFFDWHTLHRMCLPIWGTGAAPGSGRSRRSRSRSWPQAQQYTQSRKSLSFTGLQESSVTPASLVQIHLHILWQARHIVLVGGIASGTRHAGVAGAAVGERSVPRLAGVCFAYPTHVFACRALWHRW